jgi:hypothetical protein
VAYAGQLVPVFQQYEAAADFSAFINVSSPSTRVVYDTALKALTALTNVTVAASLSIPDPTPPNLSSLPDNFPPSDVAGWVAANKMWLYWETWNWADPIQAGRGIANKTLGNLMDGLPAIAGVAFLEVFEETVVIPIVGSVIIAGANLIEGITYWARTEEQGIY